MIDANVIVSAAVLGGPPRELLLEAERGSFRAVVTPYIIAQVRKVLIDKLGVSPDRVRNLLDFLPARIISDPCPEDEVLKAAHSLVAARDPTDAPVLAAALKGEVDAIVTGDKDLSTPKIRAEIRVISPSKAVELCRSASE